MMLCIIIFFLVAIMLALYVSTREAYVVVVQIAIDSKQFACMCTHGSALKCMSIEIQILHLHILIFWSDLSFFTKRRDSVSYP